MPIPLLTRVGYGRNVADPLTGGTTGARKMAVSLLTYANRAKVASRLTELGYPVTRMTVNRWAAGGEMPGIAARMILGLFLHEPDTAKAPPGEPDGAWVARMLEAIAAAVGVDTEEVERLARAAELERSRLQADASRQTEDQTARDGQ